MSHTPGPWHVQPGALAVPDQGRTIVVNHQTEEDGWWQVRSHAAPGDLQADLSLIAAAPELLLALEGVLLFVTTGRTPEVKQGHIEVTPSSLTHAQAVLTQARAAIDKATTHQSTTSQGGS